MIKKWNIGKYPYSILALPTPIAENIETANAAIAVSSTKRELRRSATNTIPKGASQLAAFIVRIAPLNTFTNTLIANPRPITPPITLKKRWVIIFLQNANCNIAVNKWTKTVAIILLSIIYLLLRAYLNYPDHRY